MAKRVKIVAVCGFGVGTSLLLRMNIESAFKEKGVDVDVENVDITTALGKSCDVFFTSAELAPQLAGASSPVIVIHNFMDKSEIVTKGSVVFDLAK